MKYLSFVFLAGFSTLASAACRPRDLAAFADSGTDIRFRWLVGHTRLNPEWARRKQSAALWLNPSQVAAFNTFLNGLRAEKVSIRNITVKDGVAYLGAYLKNEFTLYAYDLRQSKQQREITPSRGHHQWSAAGNIAVTDRYVLVADGPWAFWVYDRASLKRIGHQTLKRTDTLSPDVIVPSPFDPQEVLLRYRPLSGGEPRYRKYDVRTGTSGEDLTETEHQFLASYDPYHHSDNANDQGYRVARTRKDGQDFLSIYAPDREKPLGVAPYSRIVNPSLVAHPEYVNRVEPIYLAGNLVILDYQSLGLLTGWQSNGALQAVRLPDP